MSGHVVLIGMMGAGKTTTGRALAEALDRPFVDSDQDLAARTGSTGAALAAAQGVDALHELEADLLLEALQQSEPAVISAAASVVESASCRDALADAGLVVWLDAPHGRLELRRAREAHRRALDPAASKHITDWRRTWFAELADLTLDAEQPTDALVDEILSLLRGR